MQVWEYGCVRIELRGQQGEHRLNDVLCRLVISARDEEGKLALVQTEGRLGTQLAQMLHGCVVMCGGDGFEWHVPTQGRHLHLRRHGEHVELATYPLHSTAPLWRTDDGLFRVDFALLLQSLSGAAEWILGDLGPSYAEDDSVRVVLHQWERAWQRFSRLVTFKRLTLNEGVSASRPALVPQER